MRALISPNHPKTDHNSQHKLLNFKQPRALVMKQNQDSTALGDKYPTQSQTQGTYAAFWECPVGGRNSCRVCSWENVKMQLLSDSMAWIFKYHFQVSPTWVNDTTWTLSETYLRNWCWVCWNITVADCSCSCSFICFICRNHGLFQTPPNESPICTATAQRRLHYVVTNSMLTTRSYQPGSWALPAILVNQGFFGKE